MIAFISGIIKAIEDQKLLVYVESASIGFDIHVPESLSYSYGQEVSLFIYFHWVQENGPTLFGFTTELEKKVFSLILDCSGIGPRVALSLIAKLGANVIINAIQISDIAKLSSVSGIGSRKAEQIVISLRHKIDAFMKKNPSIDLSIPSTNMKELHEALTSLNYANNEIHAAVNKLKKEEKDFLELSFQQLLKKTLSYLAK